MDGANGTNGANASSRSSTRRQAPTQDARAPTRPATARQQAAAATHNARASTSRSTARRPAPTQAAATTSPALPRPGDAETVTFRGSDGRAYAYVAYWTGDAHGVSYRVAVAGRRQGATCAEVQIAPDEAGVQRVSLGSLGKHENCTAPPREAGHAADLARAVLERVASLYGTRRVTLQDEATFTCVVKGAAAPRRAFNVRLSEHNALVHGRAYYERKLGARTHDAEALAVLAALRRHRASPAPRDAAGLRAALAAGGRGMAPGDAAAAAEAVARLPAWPATWGELYEGVDARRDECGAALVQLMFRPALAAAGLPASHALMGRDWYVPREAQRAWPRSVLSVAAAPAGTAASSRSRATAAASSAPAPTQRGGGAAAAARARARAVRRAVDAVHARVVRAEARACANAR